MQINTKDTQEQNGKTYQNVSLIYRAKTASISVGVILTAAPWADLAAGGLILSHPRYVFLQDQHLG